MLALGYNFWTEWELQEKVDFDGLNKLIIVYPHVINLDIREDVWSAWVRWNDMEARGYDRWELAMERTGLDTIPGGQTGDSYFLRNGWRLVVNLSQVAVTGVLFSRDFGSAYYTPDLTIQFPAQVSAIVNTVNVPAQSGTKQEIATAVWAEAIRTLTEGALTAQQSLELSNIHGQVTRTVFINTENGTNGNGYQHSPFNNWSDAVDYAETNGILTLTVMADATVDRQLKNFSIKGIGLPTIDLNGHIMDNTLIERCKLTGSHIGPIQATECAVFNLSGMEGVFLLCSFAGTLTPASNKSLLISRIAPAQAAAPWTLDMNSGAPSVVGIHNTSGGIVVTNMDHAGDVLHINGSQGEVVFGATNTTGSVVCTGNIMVEDSLNGGTTIDKSRITSSLVMGVESYP